MILARTCYRSSKDEIGFDKDDIYMVDIIREELRNGDPRLS